MALLFDVDPKDWESQVLNSKEPVLVDFWHNSCVWCKRLEPELEEAAKDFSRQLRFVRFNILADEDHFKMGEKYGVMGTPTLILFCQGRVLHELVGYRPRDKLKKEIQEMVNTYQECFKQSTPLET